MANSFSCIIVDDEPLARKLLHNYIEQTERLELKGSFKSALEANDFLKRNEIDLLLLDIRMPRLSGIGFLESTQHLPAVIFTTAYEEYAAKAFELEVIDYLVKPFAIERFQKAIKRFLAYADLKKQSKEETCLIVKANHGFIRIDHDRILYVEAKGEYMKLVLADGPAELIYMRMKELEKMLGEQFIRIHKSFLVNSHRIIKMSGN